MEPSSLINSPSALIIDASTAINLNATGCADQILRALPNKVLMAEMAFSELDSDRRTGRQDSELIKNLISIDLIKVLTLGDQANSYFESLVVGSGQSTLDDGEAATIALRLEVNAIVLIDERKAQRICSERFPKLVVGCTADVFLNAQVQATLSNHDLSNAVFKALRDARMRVMPQHVQWVIQLIGAERAIKCPSLSKELRGALLQQT